MKISLVAKETDKLSTSHAVLIMNLPSIKGPEFIEPVYVVQYPENGKESIKFKPELKFKDDVEIASIALNRKSTNLINYDILFIYLFFNR